MKWVDWYESKQLKPKKGFQRSTLDLHMLMGFFGLLVIVSTLQDKLRLLTVISQAQGIDVMALQIMALAPPVGLSAAYCMIVSILSCFCHRDYQPASVNSGTEGSGSEAAGSSSYDEEGSCRPPLALSAGIVFGLSLVEGIAPLLELVYLEWWKALTTAIVLKFYLYEMCLFWCESIMCSKCFPEARPGCPAAALQLFARATRLSRDIITSSLILLMLMPFVLLNTINERCCPGCSFHNLLIYRKPNVNQKQDGEDSEWGDEEQARLTGHS